MSATRLPAVVILCGLAGAWGAGCAEVPVVELEPVVRPDGPLDLAGAPELARRNNPDLIVAAARVEAAGARADLAASAFWPSLGLAGGVDRLDRPSHAFGTILDQGEFDPGIDFNDPGPVTDWSGSVSLGWTLYDGGRREARERAARAGVLSAEARRELSRLDLELAVARGFYLAHEAALAVATGEREVAARQQAARQWEARQAEGAASRADLLAARVRLDEAHQALGNARRAEQSARRALAELLGLPGDPPLELAEPPGGLAPDASPVAAPEPEEALLATARERRPELRQVEADAAAAAARLDEAAASGLPTVELGASWRNDGGDLFEGLPHWAAGLGVVESLDELARAPARVRLAAADLRAALATARGAALAVEGDVRDARRDLEASDLRRVVAARRLELAQARRDVTDGQVESGTGTPLDRIEAERDLDRARTALVVARLDRALADCALRHATGRPPVGEGALP